MEEAASGLTLVSRRSSAAFPRRVRSGRDGARVFSVFGVIGIGFAATVISGEFRIGWGFLAIDIPGTGVAAACGYVLARRLRTRRAVRH